MTIDTIRQDITYGLRQLRRSPLFTLIASLSIAVGVIVAAAAFTLLNAVLLKPVPVENPDGLYHVFTSDHGGRARPYGANSWADYRDFASSGAFEGLAASAWRTITVRSGEEPPVDQYVTFVSDNYFDVLGLRLERGPGFRAGGAPEIVITHPHWERAYASDPDVLGRTININGTLVTIVGVAPASFRGVAMGPPIIGWIPATLQPLLTNDSDVLESRGSRGFTVVGRLAAGQSAEGTAQRLNALATGLAEQDADSWLDAHDEVRLVTVLSHREAVVPPNARSAVLVAVAGGAALVALVVLLACTNVAALLLGRAAGRQSEIAVRMTLGASRRRLIQQLLTESFLLAAIGGALSFVGLVWTLSIIRRNPMSDIFDLSIDWRVTFAAITTSIVCALAFGMAPALQSVRDDIRSRVAGTATVQKNRMRGALIALQVAIASVLILLATTAVRGVRSYVASNPGVDLDGLLYLRTDTNRFGDDSVGRRTYLAGMHELITSMPAIRSASRTALLPLGDGRTGTYMVRAAADTQVVEINTVDAAFFETTGIRALRGRTFDSGDHRGSAPVAVVNAAFIEEFGDAMLGSAVTISDRDGVEIIGVVSEIQYHDPREAATPLVYLLEEQNPWLASSKRYLMRVAPGSENAVAVELRRQLRARFPDVVLPVIAPMREATAQQTMPFRIAGNVAFAVGVIELALAAMGLYGLFLFALLARRREIGVRLALGASSRQASWAVMRDGLRYASFGIAGGILLAIPVSLIARRVLPGTGEADLLPFLFATATTLIAAAAAAWLPARRAGRVEPADALRYDA